MFDETIRALSSLDGTSISIDIPVDENGCIDRCCPSSECGKHFKVLYEDWRNKVPDERAFCPYCRAEEDPQEWNTAEQDEHIRSVGLAHIQGIVDDAISTDARRHNLKERSRCRSGFLDISMTMGFKPGHPPLIVPLKIADALRQNFNCEACGCRWSSLGSSFFCPACAYNSITAMFNSSVATVRRLVDHLDAFRLAFSDPDAAEDATRQVLEDQLGRLVGAFEQLSEALFASLPEERRAQRKGNVFQRVNDASDLWQASVGDAYDTWLTADELDRLGVLFQRRHLLVHNQGIVDRAYLKRSGDHTYKEGQRVSVRAEDISNLTDLVETLSDGLRDSVNCALNQES